MSQSDDLISRQAVIDAVHTATYGFICGAEDGDEMTEADKLVLSINKAICTAIKALPTAPNTPNALSALDCVGRQAAVDAIDKHIHTFDAIDRNYLDGLRTAMSLLKEVPSIQPESTKTDVISRRAAIDAVNGMPDCPNGFSDTYDKACIIGVLEEVPSVQPQRWIPFRSRPLTAEEKEEHPEWDAIFESPLPDDGQRILVNIKYKRHEPVQMDEYYDDDGCYLDSGYEIGTEATAWMPLPEPWRGGQDGTT